MNTLHGMSGMSNINSFDMLKSQLLTMFMFKGETVSIKDILWFMIAMSVIDYIFKYTPFILSYIQLVSNKYFNKRFSSISNSISSIKREKSSSIVIERVYDNAENNIADSILDYVTNYDGIKYVKYNKIYYVSHNDDVIIGNYKGKDIYFKLIDVKENNNLSLNFMDNNKTGNSGNNIGNNAINTITFEIYSYDLNLTNLRKYINELSDGYKIKKLNKLGDNIYYFDESIQPLPLTIDGNIQYNNAPKFLKFNMTPFYTNKSLNNMFGRDIKLVMERLRFFLNNKQWYAEKGIPHTFGVLLSGPPGCGKTSLVKAMANETGRHLINFKFHDFLTQTQVNNLFFNDRICLNGDTGESYIIPQNKRLYSLDEIDCMSDIVLDRDLKRSEDMKNNNDIFKLLDDQTMTYNQSSINNNLVNSNNSARMKELMKKMDKMNECTEKLNIGFLLNLFDGVLEIPGRMIAMATNHPEMIDKALIRPGRIDLILDFKKTTRETIIEMYKHFYDIENPELDKFAEIEDYQYSPAEINQIFFKYIREPVLALSELTQ